MASTKVKIEGELFDQAKKCTELVGYASVDEFVVHVVEKEVKKILGEVGSADSKEMVKKRLQGLGYLE